MSQRQGGAVAGFMRHRVVLAVFLLAAVVLVIGWKTMWFLCDDAFIAFRYISNSFLGYGYVWNAAPFFPVEGYTSFLWVVLLDGVWRAFGVEPPAAANAVSLVFSIGTLALTTLMVQRMALPPEFKRIRTFFLVIVLLGCVTNRTFITWTSSGLETAMFNFLVLLWVYRMAATTEHSTTRTYFVTGLVSAGVYLTRPDGLLFVAASVALTLHWVLSARARERRATEYFAFLPVAVVVGHLLWRHSFYGDWLPNTYHAKHVAWWPEAGSVYLLSFIIEYAWWLWLAVALGLLIQSARALNVKDMTRHIAPVFTIATIVAHASYYTWIIGGDHFEYRVYSYLVPLLLVSLVWMLTRLRLSTRWVLVLACAMPILAAPLPWTHWANTRHLTTREETRALFLPMAAMFPSPLRWYVATFDRSQSWLIDRAICLRHQEHKIYHLNNTSWLPDRSDGSRLSRNGFPVTKAGGVGYVAWIVPYVAVIDMKGLNDYVVARMPVDEDARRQMAHDRNPPQGYVESYRPNVAKAAGSRPQLVVVPRTEPLTSEDIVAREQYWREWIAENGDR